MRLGRHVSAFVYVCKVRVCVGAHTALRCECVSAWRGGGEWRRGAEK